MAQIRGTAGYHLGNQSPFGGPSRPEATTDPSPLDAIRQQTSKIEDMLDTLSEPIRPYVVPLFRSDMESRRLMLLTRMDHGRHTNVQGDQRANRVS